MPQRINMKFPVDFDMVWDVFTYVFHDVYIPT